MTRSEVLDLLQNIVISMGVPVAVMWGAAELLMGCRESTNDIDCAFIFPEGGDINALIADLKPIRNGEWGDVYSKNVWEFSIVSSEEWNKKSLMWSNDYYEAYPGIWLPSRECLYDMRKYLCDTLGREKDHAALESILALPLGYYLHSDTSSDNES